MLDNFLPTDFDSIAAEDLEAAARSATRRGDFVGAAAMLATGYERGGPAILLEQAYTYAHYLAISRRMLRRGAAALHWQAGDAITRNFAASYDDGLIDRLVEELEQMLQARVGLDREPSGAQLLMAELHFADGAAGDEILALLPKSKQTGLRAKFLAARTHAADGRTTCAEKLLKEIVAESQTESTALAMLGELRWKAGHREEATDWFDQSLRAIFVPVRPRDVPRGQLQFLSTVMGKYDIYAYTGGFVVVRKQADLVGVAMVGRRVFQVMMTPGYRQWTFVKRYLSRFVNVSSLRTLLLPAGDGESSSNRTHDSRVVRLAYVIYDRVMRLPGAKRLRPHLKRLAIALLPLAAVLAPVVRPLKTPTRVLWRLLRPVVRVALSAVYRFLLLVWLKAREVPQTHTTANPQEIFTIISRLEDEVSDPPQASA